MSASGFSETTMNLVEIGQESVNHRPVTALKPSFKHSLHRAVIADWSKNHVLLRTKTYFVNIVSNPKVHVPL